MSDAEETIPEKPSRTQTPAAVKANTYADHYAALCRIPFCGTRYADPKTLIKLGILPDVENLFKNMGLGNLPFQLQNGYPDVTREFLASIQLHLPTDEDYDADEYGYIEFLAKGKLYRMSLEELAGLFELRLGSEFSLDKSRFSNLPQVWETISSQRFVAGACRSSTIRNPALRYVHKFLAGTLYSRVEARTVQLTELMLLTTAAKPFLKTTSTGERIKGEGKWVHMAAFLANRLTAIREDAKTARKHMKPQITVGGIVTQILIGANVPLDDEPDSVEGLLIDESLLASSWYIGGMVDTKFVYRFHTTAGEQMKKVLLPNPRLTSLEDRENVIFLPPQSTYYDAVSSSVPVPLWKIKKEKGQSHMKTSLPRRTRAQTRAAASSSHPLEDETALGPEAFQFTPHDDPCASFPVKVAHKHIGLLQNFCIYQEQSIETMRQAIKGLKKTVKELSSKLGCQPSSSQPDVSPRQPASKRRTPPSPGVPSPVSVSSTSVSDSESE